MRNRHTAEPINPAPPVTRMRIGSPSYPESVREPSWAKILDGVASEKKPADRCNAQGAASDSPPVDSGQPRFFSRRFSVLIPYTENRLADHKGAGAVGPCRKVPQN